ncbi:hypothetical protein ACHAQH_010087 [Verticillium albo-atrum]
MEISDVMFKVQDPTGAGGGYPALKALKWQAGGGGTGSCPLTPDPGAGSGAGEDHTVTYPSPLAVAHLCVRHRLRRRCFPRLGFGCRAMPTGVQPPDYHDSKDPDGGGNSVPTRTVRQPPNGAGHFATGRTSISSRSDSPELSCDDKCKLDRGSPYNCNESGCDDQSPACCATPAVPHHLWRELHPPGLPRQLGMVQRLERLLGAFQRQDRRVL